MKSKDILQAKNKIVDNAICELKKRFVGIDEQIDTIMDNVRPWYLFPELQTRPLVISLWGLSGSGKTHLVRTIAQLLDIERDMTYWNFAQIGEQTAWEIEGILDEINFDGSNNANHMFVYDEFQYAATLDSKGAEKDNRSALKPFWELMDSGIIHQKSTFLNVRILGQLLQYIQIIDKRVPMEVINGRWVNMEKCLEKFSSRDRTLFMTVFNDTNVESSKNSGYFLNDETVSRISKIYKYCVKSVDNEVDFTEKLFSMDLNEAIDFVSRLYSIASKGYDLNFSQSIIFVIGNLDEAYEVAFNVDPDMSPDNFHQLTKKISVVDIKEALQRRFRNEQIARLGNIHVIYPSFSKSTFQKIIHLSIEEYRCLVKQQTNIDLEFDDSIYEAIYNEAVFPTHGTRPIFSSVHEILKTKLPIVFTEALKKNVTISRIVYSFKRKHVILTCFDENNEVLFVQKISEKMRLDSLRESTKDEEQSLVAAHESGHFVVYMCLTGKTPEKLCSRTAGNDSGGFLMKDYSDTNAIYSKHELLNEIKILLGGYVAEKITFGDDMLSTGASSDLRKATTIASSIVRDYGMSEGCVVTTYLNTAESTNGGLIVHDDTEVQKNQEIRRILNECENEVRQILSNKEWQEMFKQSALYLSVHSTMPKRKMKELYDKISVTERHKQLINDDFYRNKIKNL